MGEQAIVYRDIPSVPLWALWQAMKAESTPEHRLDGIVLHAACSCGSYHPVIMPTPQEVPNG